MPCYSPLSGYYARQTNKSGKRSIVFDLKLGYQDMPVQVPCGQCIGCRLDYSRSWAIRCLHEAETHIENCFITLTYDDNHLPSDGSLVKHHLQDFFKRLRRRNEPKKIKYYACGEYGEKYSRPHYHACVFNHDFEDKELWSTKQGTKLYISKELQSLWPKGFSTIGDVTFDSAAYVARYILKKQNSNTDINISDDAYNNAILADGKYYSKFCKEHGLMSHPIQPEYTTMSRRPGIAYEWYKKYKSDIYPDDFIVIKGRKMPPPKYYEYLYEIDNENVRVLKKRRKTLSIRRKADNTYDRLKTREICAKAKINLKKRNLEEI